MPSSAFCRSPAAARGRHEVPVDPNRFRIESQRLLHAPDRLRAITPDEMGDPEAGQAVEGSCVERRSRIAMESTPGSHGLVEIVGQPAAPHMGARIPRFQPQSPVEQGFGAVAVGNRVRRVAIVVSHSGSSMPVRMAIVASASLAPVLIGIGGPVVDGALRMTPPGERQRARFIAMLGQDGAQQARACRLAAGWSAPARKRACRSRLGRSPSSPVPRPAPRMAAAIASTALRTIARGSGGPSRRDLPKPQRGSRRISTQRSESSTTSPHRTSAPRTVKSACEELSGEDRADHSPSSRSQARLRQGRGRDCP